MIFLRAGCTVHQVRSVRDAMARELSETVDTSSWLWYLVVFIDFI